MCNGGSALSPSPSQFSQGSARGGTARQIADGVLWVGSMCSPCFGGSSSSAAAPPADPGLIAQRIGQRVEARVGRLPFTGRFHRSFFARRLEDWYEPTDVILGRGSTGSVRLANGRGSKAGQKYAIKTFWLQGMNARNLAALEVEVEMLLCVDHPHAVRLVDVFETPCDLHLVMECLDGGELFERITRCRRFKESDAANAIRQMLLVVRYLHSNYIAHRDLKPENFMYESKEGDHLKLIDFGFSRLWSPGTRMRARCGTLGYAAPEVFGENYTGQCDLWSLGVIAFMVLSGETPFDRSDTEVMRAGKVDYNEDTWRRIHPDARHLVQGLLTVDPTRRLTARQALEHPWVQRHHAALSPVRALYGQAIETELRQALREFSRGSSFWRSCMAMMAWCLTAEEFEVLRVAFLHIDELASGDGAITLEVLQKALKDQNFDREEVNRIFEALDADGDNRVGYSEFLAALIPWHLQDSDRLLRDAFDRFDVDCSGYITEAHLQEVLGSAWNGESAAAFAEEATPGDNGRKISYEDFARIVMEPLSADQQEPTPIDFCKADEQ